jgi:hypothetical protein
VKIVDRIGLNLSDKDELGVWRLIDWFDSGDSAYVVNRRASAEFLPIASSTYQIAGVMGFSRRNIERNCKIFKTTQRCR